MTESPLVLVVMGVSGTGKSTVAGLLAQRLDWDLEEGDALHPAANVAKMAAGVPLTDEDRWPWLALVADWVRAHLAAGTHGVITCSALKRRYRDVLRAPGVEFVHLTGSTELIGERVRARVDHFMPASLLDSQLAALEPPEPDEAAISVDVGAEASALVDEIVSRLRLG